MARRLVRRSNSTTSLSKYFHDLPDPDQTSLDFCNSFWGPNDCGVEVLFARMRGAARTMEEMREFWKERIAIEAEYAKKLAKLAKRPLGRDEIGGFRSALDKLLSETDVQAAEHFNSAQTMKRVLEKTSNEFVGKQNNHKAIFQAAIEKSYKTKQFHEGNVEKARKKYEAGSALVDSYTALLTLPQGDTLNDTQTKLERAERDAQARQKEHKDFTRTVEETCRRWEGEWKTYCDQCQDLEDERLEFLKDVVWAYANVVSTVCVADDESCERIRLCLDEIDVDKEIENFVNDYGTGSMISEPMSFVRHGQGDAIHGPKQKMAKFLRTSVRGASPSTQSTSSVGLLGDGTTGPGLDVHIGWSGGEESHSSDLGDSPPLPPLPLTPPIALLNVSTTSLISEAPENNVNPDSLHESDVKLKACVPTDPEARSDGRLWDLISVSRWIDNIHKGFFALNRRDIVKLLTVSLLFGTVGIFIAEHHVRKNNEVHPVVYVPKADAATTSGPSCCNR